MNHRMHQWESDKNLEIHKGHEQQGWGVALKTKRQVERVSESSVLLLPTFKTLIVSIMLPLGNSFLEKLTVETILHTQIFLDLQWGYVLMRRRQWHPTPVLLPGKSHGRKSLEGCSPWDCWGLDTTERLHFHFHALEKEMATRSSVLAWRIPGTGEPGGLPSMVSHRVGHDWSDLAEAAAVCLNEPLLVENAFNYLTYSAL